MTGVLIVTGGGRGIGAAIARAASRQGYKVCVNYSRAEGDAEAVASEIRAMGTDALAVKADVSREDDVAAMFETVDDRLGPVTVLVNNAGILQHSRIDELDRNELRRVFAVNVEGMVMSAREAVKRMSTKHRGKGGVIVNVSSVSARTGGGPGNVIYATSKGAIDAFTLGLAKEVAQEGIRVCGVRPGITETEIFSGGDGVEAARTLARDIVPMGQIARPEEIAAAVLWLCSPAASYVTGTLLDVTGGR